jgi:hypothetical protein
MGFRFRMADEQHHYVPQFLLRRFCHNNSLYVFDKSNRRSFRANPRNVMGERGYNSIQLKDRYVLDFEAKFTFIEGKAAPVIGKIVREESIVDLTPTEEAVLYGFLTIQHLRAKASRNSYLGVNKEIRRRFPDLVTNDHPEFFTDEEYEKFCLIRSSLDGLERLAAHFATKHSFLMKRACQSEIYISDNPLVLHNQKDHGPYGNIGLAVPGIEIYYPLSPELILAFMCRTTLAEIQQGGTNARSSLASAYAAAFKNGTLFLPSESSALKKAKLEIDSAEAYRIMLVERRLVPVSNEGLEYVNSLQVMWAHRFVAARRKDFAFAEKVLQEKPHWRDHPRIHVA